MSESEFSVVAGTGADILFGRKSRTAAAVFNYGNIIATTVQALLGNLWLGTSMLVCATNPNHHDSKVGYYTQHAAYRFHGVSGFFLAVAAFIPRGRWNYYLAAWALAAAILIPWSIFDLIRIWRDRWDDLRLPVEGNDQDSHKH